jgi:CDP-paratose 2-epimerase
VPRVLVTGGAGFVGGNVSVALAERHSEWEIVAFDNLRRRGSELQLARLRQAGVQFLHGDVRQREDLAALGDVDAIVECSAEPSALAGLNGGLDYLIHSNLVGAYNCLELARGCDASMVFLSTSRVYSVDRLRALDLEETDTRFDLGDAQVLPGASPDGIAEDFPTTDGSRTLYGSTKLAAELLIAEYRATFGLRCVVNRCGVIAGPWQMGKVDQGVFTFWLLRHELGLPLSYIGFGGSGKQVRDLLHVVDLAELVNEQLEDQGRWDGLTVNVGGGRDFSLSLAEATRMCQEMTGREVTITPVADTRAGDVPLYISDCELLYGHTSWRPSRGPREVLEDTLSWIREYRAVLTPALGVDVVSPSKGK